MESVIKDRFYKFLKETSNELGLPEIYIAKVVAESYLKGEIDIYPVKPVLRGGIEKKRENTSIWEYIRP